MSSLVNELEKSIQDKPSTDLSELVKRLVELQRSVPFLESSRTISDYSLVKMLLPDGKPFVFSQRFSNSRASLKSVLTTCRNRLSARLPLGTSLLQSLLSFLISCEEDFIMEVSAQSKASIGDFNRLLECIIVFDDSRRRENLLPLPHVIQQRRVSFTALEGICQSICGLAKSPTIMDPFVFVIAEAVTHEPGNSSLSCRLSGLEEACQTQGVPERLKLLQSDSSRLHRKARTLVYSFRKLCKLCLTLKKQEIHTEAYSRVAACRFPVAYELHDLSVAATTLLGNYQSLARLLT